MLNFLRSLGVAGIVRKVLSGPDGRTLNEFDLKSVSVDPLAGVWDGIFRLDVAKIRERMAEIVATQKKLRPVCHAPLPFYQAPAESNALDYYKASQQFYKENPVWAAKREYEILAIEMTGLLCLRACAKKKLHIQKIGRGKRGPRYGIYKDTNPFTQEDQFKLVRDNLKDWSKYLKKYARVA